MTPLEQCIHERRADQPAAQHQHPAALRLYRRALASGTVASLLSTLAVSVFSRRKSGATAAGTNAASQWFWYPRARHVDRPSLRHTLVGYAVHHASSVFWACGFEALRPRSAPPSGRAARAAGIAALAYCVDYHVVPRRFSPGFEHRIRPAGMLAAYALFGVGLYLVASVRPSRPDPRRARAAPPPVR